MAVDPGPLGQKVAEFMGDLEEEYGEDAELSAALIVVEVAHGDDDDPVSTVEARTVYGAGSTVGIGLATRAIEAMK